MGKYKGGKELGGGKEPSFSAQPVTDNVIVTSQLMEVLIYTYEGGGWVGANCPCATHQFCHEVDMLLFMHG